MNQIRGEQQELLTADQQAALSGLLADAELDPASVERMEAAVARLPIRATSGDSEGKGVDVDDDVDAKVSRGGDHHTWRARVAARR